jgi:hypothetical protein
VLLLGTARTADLGLELQLPVDRLLLGRRLLRFRLVLGRRRLLRLPRLWPTSTRLPTGSTRQRFKGGPQQRSPQSTQPPIGRRGLRWRFPRIESKRAHASPRAWSRKARPHQTGRDLGAAHGAAKAGPGKKPWHARQFGHRARQGGRTSGPEPSTRGAWTAKHPPSLAPATERALVFVHRPWSEPQPTTPHSCGGTSGPSTAYSDVGTRGFDTQPRPTELLTLAQPLSHSELLPIAWLFTFSKLLTFEIFESIA